MVDSGDLDTSNNMHMQCLWFSFQKVLNNELSRVRSKWNTHYIRKSRYQTMAGISEILYFLPEEVGSEDYKKPFNPADVREAKYEVHSAVQIILMMMKKMKPATTNDISITHFKLSELITRTVGEKACMFI